MNPIDNHPSKVTAHHENTEHELLCYKIGFRVSMVVVVLLIIGLYQCINKLDSKVIINPKYSVR